MVGHAHKLIFELKAVFDGEKPKCDFFCGLIIYHAVQVLNIFSSE